MKKYLLTLLMIASAVLSVNAADGDIKTSTVNGITWTYTIVSENAKTCMLGGVIKPSQPYYDETYYTAISRTITGAITTPQKLDGYTVTSLCHESFSDCMFSSIVISSGVKTIGNKAFRECSNLVSVSIPEGVTLIDEEAFSECPISSIILPESLIRLGEQAFEHTNLTTITIPKNVAFLGNEDRIENGEFVEEDDLYADVFNGCRSLQEVKVAPENQTYTDVDGILMTKDLKTMLYCPPTRTEVVIPQEVERIGVVAFDDCSALSTVKFNAEQCVDFDDVESPFTYCPIKEIIFGSTVHHVPNNIASQIRTLETVTIGKSVKTIGNTPFAGCSGIKVVNYNAVNAAYTGGLNNLEIMMFKESPIETVNFGNEVKTIPNYFIGYSEHLTSVVISDQVDSIGSRAFYECRNIKTITLGASIKAYTGFYCSVQEDGQITREPPYLEHIYVSCNNPYMTMADDVIYNKNMTEISYYPSYRSNPVYNVPTSLISLGIIRFRGLYKLHIININHDVEIPFWDEIHKVLSPFDLCYGLEEINVNGHSKYTSIDGVLYTKDKKALACYPIGRVASTYIVPSTVEEIYAYAARGNINLKQLDISDNVSIIHEFAFANSKSLTSVVIGKSLSVLSRCCFSGCSELSSVTLQEGLKVISANAFNNCSSLANISLPSSLKSIGSQAFQNTSLQSVNLPDGLLSIGRYSFRNSKLDATYIPKSVLYVGESAFGNTPWYNSNVFLTSNHVLVRFYGSDVTIPSEIRIIAGGAGNTVNSMSSLNAHAAIESIGSKAIGSSCPWYYNLGDGLNYVGSTLYYAKNMTSNSATVREGTKGIAGRAFYNALSLEHVTLPEGLITIGEDAFLGSGITSIDIPEGTKYIGYDAFCNCPNLVRVSLPSTVEVIDDFAFEPSSYISPTTSFYCAAVTPPLLSECAFYYAASSGDLRENCTLYVPRESVNLYKATDGWKQFKSILPIGSGDTTGDVNGDNKVDIEDVNAVINIILELKAQVDYPGNADVTGDNKVDIEDVNAVINTILAN